MLKPDYRLGPVRRIVVMGESNAYGMCAGDPLNEWVQALAFLIRRFQDGPLRVFNNSIPANVVSPRAPGYGAFPGCGTAPSALERFEQDMISYQPDLAIYAYGLNDSRCGHALDSFIADYGTIIARTRERLPDALLVLVGPYWNTQYEADEWTRHEYDAVRQGFGAFAVGGSDLVLSYNKSIADLAARHGALFVDVYSVTERASWLLNGDQCHFNDVGQWLIGQTVFGAIAANCSFVGRKSAHAAAEAGLTIHTTGGTNALPDVIEAWRPPS
ncbi:MAG: GDSL-type esterase/lipase family protein [Armatimonadetes bacterium]|nr:GDSL-type esterase/lipase family protein [Armatimonadota bacterium]